MQISRGQISVNSSQIHIDEIALVHFRVVAEVTTKRRQASSTPDERECPMIHVKVEQWQSKQKTQACIRSYCICVV